MVFGTLVLNDDTSRCFFHSSEIFIFGLLGGLKMKIASVTYHISGTVKHIINIFGTFVLDDDISWYFFIYFLKLIFLGLLGG